MDQSRKKSGDGHMWGIVKWLIVAVVVIVNLYADIKMYANGDIAYPLLDIILVGAGVVIFTNKRLYAHRYAFPSVAGMSAFIIFPLVYTVWIAFTNYSGDHVMTVEGAMNYHLQKNYKVAGGDYDFKLLKEAGSKYSLFLSQGDKFYKTAALDLMTNKQFSATADAKKKTQKEVALQEFTIPSDQDAQNFNPGTVATPKELMEHRMFLRSLTLVVPSAGPKLSMSTMQRFSAEKPKFTLEKYGHNMKNGTVVKDKYLLLDNETGKLFKPNMETGFYQYLDDKGQFTGDPVAPGFKVYIGWDNFSECRSNPSVRFPFLKIFIWTVVFAAFTVASTLAIGMVLACLVQWPFLRFRSIYRMLLVLPYAVPSFISILVFKGLFNQNFGEINVVMKGLFGWMFEAGWPGPDWFTNPTYAKVMILLVNAWLGYPYMMILCMGLLKSIPDDLYEASAMDGAGPWINFKNITFPLLMKPLTPLLIASFAFNFNNFVLIQLLTNGGPDMIDTTEVPAGHTDLLVSFTYRIAFEGGKGNDYGLAAAIATLIFLLVGAIALLQLKLTKQKN